jgi:hypothetical protein
MQEGKLEFSFQDGWIATKVDGWAFYRNQFQKIGGQVSCEVCGERKSFGTKAVDFLAIDPDLCCWFIEIKDYTEHERIKSIEIATEIALKFRDSLALLAAAQVCANNSGEREFASRAMKCQALRLVVHVEGEPDKQARGIHVRESNVTNQYQKLRTLVHGIDPSPLRVSIGDMSTVGWTCSRVAPAKRSAKPASVVEPRK